MLQLYKLMVRPHLEYAVQFLSPNYGKYIELLETCHENYTNVEVSTMRGTTQSAQPLFTGKETTETRLNILFQIQ